MYQWKRDDNEGQKSMSLWYKDTLIGHVRQVDKRKFRAFKLGEPLGEYKTALEAQQIVECKWVSM